MINLVCILSLSEFRMVTWLVFQNLDSLTTTCVILAGLGYSIQLANFILHKR